MNDFELTDDQKAKIEKEFKNDPDLKSITQKVFGDEDLDGRSKEGRAVRAFLAKKNMTYKTTLVDKVEEIDLTKEQKEFLMSDNIEQGINPLEAARLVFRDRSIQTLSQRHRVVVDFMRKYRPEMVDENEMITRERWTPPRSLSKAIKKINDWAGQAYDELTIQTKQKKMCERLLFYLKSPRFNNFINQYSTFADRDLFESEFVRAIWDKPDLTIDELNLYVTVCTNYVRQKHIQQRLDKLNALLNDSDNERDITMRLTEIIKATSEELNQCEKRIESLTKDLNGSRQNRLKAKGEQNGSIFALVEAFQDKEERDRMILMANLQNKLIEEEADRLETMDEYKARILGISKRELL
jgi:SHS2 domain-containing protein